MPELQLEERRGFLTGAIFGLMGAIGAALGLPALGYLFVPPKTRRQQTWVEATELSKLMLDQPEQVIFQRVRRDGWKTVTERAAAWVVRTGENKVVAFSPICTHLGCAVSWDTSAKSFACPCHTSSFSPDGQVVAGPAPRALDRFDVRVDDGKIMLGEIRQSAEG